MTVSPTARRQQHRRHRRALRPLQGLEVTSKALVNGLAWGGRGRSTERLQQDSAAGHRLRRGMEEAQWHRQRVN